MKYFLILTGVALLIAVATVSSEHAVKKTAAGKHVDAAEKKKHHFTKQNTKKASHHEVEKAKKGKSEAVAHKVEDAEKGGKKHHAVDTAQHHVAHHDAGGDAHKASFKHADHQKKTGSIKGYREQYHKDEHKKADSFYSNKHKSGSWLKYGAANSKHHAVHHNKDSNGKFQAGKHSEKHGKDHKIVQGHKHVEHKGYKVEEKHDHRKETPNKHEAHLSKFVQYKKKSHK